MNSRKPKFDDELGDLIRNSLRQETDEAEPSPEVWKQIKRRLQMVDAPIPQPRRRIPMPPPVIQAVFIMLLIVIGGIGLRPTHMVDDGLPILTPPGSEPASSHFVDEYSASPGVELPADTNQLRLMKIDMQTTNRSHPARHIDQTPLMSTAPDAMPHPLSPEGRQVFGQMSRHVEPEAIIQTSQPLEVEPVKDIALVASGARLIQ